MTDLPPAEAAEVRVPYDAGQPVLATGLAAFLIANGVGDLSLARETRGAVLDWGGPYAQGVHLTGPWRVEYRVGPMGDFAPLPAMPRARAHLA
ncbi:MAG: hypothetical protein L3K08_08190, partial [Thermoplasmata archaeon]|nr:hypothetical protein [Thermoplasmata archaeon]